MIILINESKETETFFCFFLPSRSEEEMLISTRSLASNTPFRIQIGIYLFAYFSILLLSYSFAVEKKINLR